MKQKLFKLFLLMLCLSCINTNLYAALGIDGNNQKLHIVKIESLDQLSKAQSQKVVYFFDLDDTIFDSPYMLGSKAWRKYILEATKDEPENWHDIFSLFIARNHPLETVEGKTSQFVRELQMEGFAVFGFTARERKIWYDKPEVDVDQLTVNQLESVGINFNSDFLIKAFPYLTDSPEYFGGIFFADVEPKGEYLLKLFKDAPQLPEKVIFVDDKQSQVESVAIALEQLGIDYECYWYTITDKKAQKFEPLIANIQLYYLCASDGKQVISDREAASISRQHPERDSGYYLQELLKTAKIKSFNKEPLCPKK